MYFISTRCRICVSLFRRRYPSKGFCVKINCEPKLTIHIDAKYLTQERLSLEKNKKDTDYILSIACADKVNFIHKFFIKVKATEKLG